MFDPDKPIDCCKDDLLERCKFAEHLGNSIISYDKTDSLVIGLLGKWGSGKTSIINMVLEYIGRSSKNDKAIIMKFNPWYYSDQEQLFSRFFDQLSAILGKKNYSNTLNNVGDLLKIYSSSLKLLSIIPVMHTFANVVENAGNIISDLSSLQSTDLDTIKSKLNKLLSKQKHKIIIVIDDIDRLKDREIRQIFQLVKSLGNFSNTVYLMAFDRLIVENALNKYQEGFGMQYLEKIIQVPIEVPMVPEQKLIGLLSRQLKQIIDNTENNNFNKEYWWKIYYSGFKDFFRTLRDVYRYINTLKFNLIPIKNDVNLADFFAVTAIQVFIPKLYAKIRDQKDLFIGKSISEMLESTKADELKEQYNEIIRKTSYLAHDIVESFLRTIFPKVDCAYNNMEYNIYDDYRNDLRVCSPDTFDRYFRFSLLESELSQKESTNILSSSNDKDIFSQKISELNDDKKIQFIEYLGKYIQKGISKETIESIIATLINIGDKLPANKNMLIDIQSTVYYMVSNLLEKLNTSKERYELLTNAISNAKEGIYTIVYIVERLIHEYKKPSNSNNALMESSQIKALKKLVCEKIKELHEKGILANYWGKSDIAYEWKEFGCVKEANEFINNIIESDEGLLDFIIDLSSRFSRSFLSSKDEKINLQRLSKLVDLKETEKRIKSIRSSPKFNQLDEERKYAIRAFLNSVKSK